jgi:hypothetical protein
MADTRSLYSTFSSTYISNELQLGKYVKYDMATDYRSAYTFSVKLLFYAR